MVRGHPSGIGNQRQKADRKQYMPIESIGIATSHAIDASELLYDTALPPKKGRRQASYPDITAPKPPSRPTPGVM
jgi:hypothetical protein